MLRIAVCDDNAFFMKHTSALIHGCFKKDNLEHIIETFTRGTEFLKVHEEKPYDIVFLDILMPDDIDGFSIAKSIRRMSEKTYIIFLTTERNLVYDSLDFRPFHFVPKGDPDLLEKRIQEVCTKLTQHLIMNQACRMSVNLVDDFSCKLGEIIYMRVEGNYVEIISNNVEKNATVRNTLANIEQMLPDNFFMKLTRGTILNMQHISRIRTKECKVIMDNGDELEYSRRNHRDIEKRYAEYLSSFE